jgi:CRISPR-associated protein Cas2
MAWLIAYDITCPRRWRRFYALVRAYGVRVQWSVFLVTETPFRKAAFLSAAARLIDTKTDDVRLYQVTLPCAEAAARGSHPRLPAGLHWRALKSRSGDAS